jgi:glutamate racemase
MSDGLVSSRLAAPSRIGIFDSGVGGLTVLRELYRQLPNESILYFGDTARLPYGPRSPKEILQFVREILTWMTTQEVKMVMMACNTSSALVLEQVQAEFPFPILGIVWPGARAAAQQGRRIGLIATEATVKSNAYRQAILEVCPERQVWQVSCPEFVPLIEQNRIHELHTYQVAERYLAPLKAAEIDTLIYGCTHYPYLEPVLQAVLPQKMTFIDPAVHLVAAAAQELDALGLRSTALAWPTQFYVSGVPRQFADTAVQLIGHKPVVSQVRLPAVAPSPVDSLRVGSQTGA